MRLIYFAFGILICTSSCSMDTSGEATPEAANPSEQKVPEANLPQTPQIDFAALSTMNSEQLRLARNEIYAKYGRVFTDKKLQEHFKAQSWYTENPNFKESDIDEKDKSIIRVIENWEDAGKKLFGDNVDLNNDGTLDAVYVFKNKNADKVYATINGESYTFNINWDKNDTEGASDWYDIPVRLVDIDKKNPFKQIHISQRQYDIEDPGTDNYILDYSTGHLIVSEESSSDYDSGIMSFDGSGIISMVQSYCPDHVKYYKLVEGVLTFSHEDKKPMPKEGCAACFTAEMLVSISETEKTPISWLKKGDKVLTYDFSTEKNKQVTIEEMVRVPHDQFIEYRFDHDTVISTLDHPYYLKKKGWASFDPSATLSRYSNYTEVNQIEDGDIFILQNGKKAKLKSFLIVDAHRQSYTITKLSDGKCFYVNDILVGTEDIIQPTNWLSQSNPSEFDFFNFDNFNLDGFFEDFNFDSFNFSDSANGFFFKMDTSFTFRSDTMIHQFQFSDPNGSFFFRMDTSFNFSDEFDFNMEGMKREMDSLMKLYLPDSIDPNAIPDSKEKDENEEEKSKKIEGTRRI